MICSEMQAARGPASELSGVHAACIDPGTARCKCSILCPAVAQLSWKYAQLSVALLVIVVPALSCFAVSSHFVVIDC